MFFLSMKSQRISLLENIHHTFVAFVWMCPSMTRKDEIMPPAAATAAAAAAAAAVAPSVMTA